MNDEQNKPMIAPCGMNCTICPIFIAACNPEAARQLADGWRKAGHENAKPEWFRCRGCRADRSVCWTEDCKIYDCCVDEKGLEFCNECDEFPCKRLEDWAASADHHIKALDYLRESKNAK